MANRVVKSAGVHALMPALKASAMALRVPRVAEEGLMSFNASCTAAEER